MQGFLLVGLLLTSPGQWPLRGLHQVYTASTEGPRVLSLNVLGLEAFVKSQSVEGLRHDLPAKGTDYLFAADLRMGLGFSWNAYLEQAVGVTFSGDAVYTDDNVYQIPTASGDTLKYHNINKASYGFGDLYLAAKLSLPFRNLLYGALMPELWVPLGPRTFRDSTQLQRGKYPWVYRGGYYRRLAADHVVPGVRLLLSLQPNAYWGLHLNFGYRGSRLDSETALFLYGAGLEFNLGQVSLFLEDYTERLTGSAARARYGDGYGVASFGFRSGRFPGGQFQLYGFMVHQHREVADTIPTLWPSFTPDFGVGMTFVFGRSFFKPGPVEMPVKPVVTPTGSLAGVVTDASSLQPLAAKVSLLKPAQALETLADSQTGQYRFDSVPAGLYTLRATHPGYEPLVLSVVIKPGEEIVRDLALTPKKEEAPATGVITGRVFDQKTQAPVYARISFVGTEIAPVYTDSSTGVFRVEVPAGTYALKIEAPGSIPPGRPVVVKPDQPVILDVGLLKKGTHLVFQNIYFAPGSARLDPSSYPALDQIVQLLKENPTVIVEIQGHTDNTGSLALNMKLSQQRAEAVKRYLVEHGIEEDRLIAKGYGPKKPIAPNDTPENRAKNRRVEIVVLGEKLQP